MRTGQVGVADVATSWRRQQTATVQPGGADSLDWRVRRTEPYSNSQGRHRDGRGRAAARVVVSTVRGGGMFEGILSAWGRTTDLILQAFR